MRLLHASPPTAHPRPLSGQPRRRLCVSPMRWLLFRRRGVRVREAQCQGCRQGPRGAQRADRQEREDTRRQGRWRCARRWVPPPRLPQHQPAPLTPTSGEPELVRTPPSSLLPPALLPPPTGAPPPRPTTHRHRPPSPSPWAAPVPPAARALAALSRNAIYAARFSQHQPPALLVSYRTS